MGHDQLRSGPWASSMRAQDSRRPGRPHCAARRRVVHKLHSRARYQDRKNPMAFPGRPFRQLGHGLALREHARRSADQWSDAQGAHPYEQDRMGSHTRQGYGAIPSVLQNGATTTSSRAGALPGVLSSILRRSDPIHRRLRQGLRGVSSFPRRAQPEFSELQSDDAAVLRRHQQLVYGCHLQSRRSTSSARLIRG